MRRAFNFLRAALLVLLFALMLFAAWLINTEAGLHWAVERARPYLPGELQIVDLRGRISGPIRLDALSYHQDDGLALELGEVRLDWSPSALLVGQLRFSEITAQRLRIELPPAQPESDGAPPSLPDIALPLSVALGELELNHIQIQRPDQAPIDIDHLGLAATLHWDDLDIRRLEVAAYDAHLTLSGAVELSGDYAHDVAFDWRLAHSPVGAARGSGSLAGDVQRSVLTHNLNQPVAASAELTLLDLLQQPGLEGRLRAEPFALQTLMPELPAATLAVDTRLRGNLQQLHLDGEFRLRSQTLTDLDGRLQLSAAPDLAQVEALRLRAPDGSRRASLHGQWQPGDNLAEFALSWHGLGWPLQGETQVRSAKGSAYFKGTPEAYHFSLAGGLDSPYWSDSQVRAIGSGTLEGLEITRLTLLTLDGEVSGPVQLAWADAFSWTTKLTAQGLNPGQRWPDWPGRIGFQIDSQGNTRDGLSATLDIARLDGNLRQFPVRLSGRLAWQDETLTLRQVEFRSAESLARADGRIGTELALDWELQSQQLSQLYPDVKGSLTASGSLSGPRATPLLRLRLKGERLGWQDYAVGRIEAEGQADLFRWQQIALDSHAERLSLAGQELEGVTIDLTNEQQRQQLALEIKHAAATLQLRAAGRLDAQAWNGELSGIRIDSRDFGSWRQRQPVTLQLSAVRASLQRFCLDSRDANACVRLDYAQPTWSAAIESSNFPLALLSPLLQEQLALNGTADISLQATLDERQQLRARGEIQLDPGGVEVRMLDNEIERWDYQRGILQVTLDQDALTASVRLTVSAEDQLSASVELPQFDPFDFNPDRQALRASASLTLEQLDLLQGMIYEARDIQGRLTLEAQARGTLGAPELSGRLALVDAAVGIPRLGIRIRNINLSADGNDREVNYRLEADSGGGHLTARGETRLQPEAGWPTEIRIEGKDFEVANIPEARVDVSPDIGIDIKGRRIEVDGTVRIPYAKLQPKDISSAKLPSDDVRIEGAPPATQDQWQIYSSVRLILSERVFLNGFGFEGRISGDVLLKTEPGRPPIGVGELRVVEGRYSAYGQRLDIQRGRLLFASSPLNNPGLDLRAVRQIQDVTAGVSVTGTLRNPKFEVFSNPAMGQTDALAYLLLGRPLEEGASSDGSVVAGAALALGLKGGDFLARKIGDRFGLDVVRVETSQTGEEASLLMGRYLSPDLYISYGVGLIEAVNTLKLRYEITDNWQLTAESGEEQAADLLYIFERGD